MPWLTPNSVPEAAYTCRPLFIPNDRDLIAAVRGALLDLTYLRNWESFGEADPPEVTAAMMTMLERFDHERCGGMDVGIVFPYISENPPAGSIPCDGTEYEDSDYPALWAVIDPAWKTDGSHFAVPNAPNNFIVGAGDEYAEGETGGEAEHMLTLAEMPSHDGHSHFTVNTPLGTQASYAQNTPQGTSYGGNDPHENRPPFVALKFAVQAE